METSYFYFGLSGATKSRQTDKWQGILYIHHMGPIRRSSSMDGNNKLQILNHFLKKQSRVRA